MRKDVGALVIGGGFYGCCVARLLQKRFTNVTLLEAGAGLLTRASYRNQARVHNGYHYPRSFLTGLRSGVNFPRFVADFADCIDQRFEKLYAIAQINSKVNAYQFGEFCRNIGAPVRPARHQQRALFNPALIEDVFVVQEYAFDAVKLGALMRESLEGKVEVVTGSPVAMVESLGTDGRLRVRLADGDVLTADYVFNCTYSRINSILRRSGVDPLPFKHEITELALVEPPPELGKLGVTVMDGPFFSTMPFPAEQLHSLSHVRYTPHESWSDRDVERDPYDYLEALNPQSRQLFMIRDSQRYLPCISRARYVRSLYEVKTVLMQNESDDGRPILLRRHDKVGNFFSVMGGKIDNVYDVLTALEQLDKAAAAAAVSNALR